MTHYFFVISALITGSVLAEELKINVYPTVNYTQRFNIINTNNGYPQPEVSAPITPSYFSNNPHSIVISDYALSDYSLLKKCCIVTAFTAASSYAAIIGYLLAQSYAIDNENRWYNWKKEVPLAALLEIPSTQVAEALQTSLCKKYNGTMNNVMTISADLYEEEQELKRIISCCSWIKQYKTSFLFFKKDSIAELAEQKLQRLLFIKEIVIKHIHTLLEHTTTVHEG